MRDWIARLFIAGSTLFFTIPASSADPNAVIIQVGKQTLTVAALQRRWLELPAFQRKALGNTDLERIQRFVSQWIVPELLLAQVAADRKILSSERRQAIEKSVLQQVLTDRIRKQSDAISPVTDADIKAYLESHRQDFDRPEQLRLFRILLATEAEATDTIQKLRHLPDFDKWRNLAREKSLDRATNMRGGELGFVAADGKSDIVELQVNAGLFSAAAHLKDGEIAKSPIREGDKFAVVWRRGHVAALRADLASVATTIRAHLRESRAAAAFNELLAQLKAKYVKDLNPNRLDGVDFGESPNDQFRAVTPERNVEASP